MEGDPPAEAPATEERTDQQSTSDDVGPEEQAAPAEGGDSTPEQGEPGSAGQPAGADGQEGEHSDFADEVNAQAPPPGPPDRLYEIGDSWRQAGDDAQGARDEAERFASATQPDWRDPAGNATRDRAAASATEAEAAAADAKAMSEHATASADEIARARQDGQAAIGQAESQDAIGQALLPEAERDLVRRRLVAQTANENQQRYAAAADNVRQRGQQLEVAGTQAGGPAEVPAQRGNGARGQGPGSEVPDAASLRAGGNLASLTSRTVDEAAGSMVETTANIVDRASKWLSDVTGNDTIEAVADVVTPEMSEWLGGQAADGVLNAGSWLRNEAYKTARALDGQDPPLEVYLDTERHQHSLQHINEARDGKIWSGNHYTPGEPKLDPLTVERDEAKSRRNASLRGIPYGWEVGLPRHDRDEYPLAMTEEGGAGASVKHIPRSDNRSAGSTIGHQTSNLSDGDRFVIRETE
ncbi:NucA/NucB deoxyribonuclease domain-containing protein [Saccharomonospora sp. NPDC046836]|uniref:NucA/NucB deoxyribonuclease domain-containing protein n=1 Tax=Saccharomonospora sp. NPDC046836 TaxID=3156921 RepID=UPI00340ED60A